MGTCVLELATCILVLTAASSGSYIRNGIDDDESPKPTSVNDLSGPELASRMTFGTRVVRGKDWEWADQDGGRGAEGTVIRGLLTGWVKVEWDSGETHSYRMGSEGKYDLYIVDAQASPETLTGPELASRMKVGVRVVRGKDWIWDDQDGGSGGKGTIIRRNLNGWVRVEWESGDINSYRMGSDGKYDLYLADPHASISATESTTTATELETARSSDEITENSEETTKNIDETTEYSETTEYDTRTREDEITMTTTLGHQLSGPQLVALMTVGTRVVRGKDWEWLDQDGGAGNKGTVIRGVVDGWVRVRWDSGDENSYRMGDEERYDLDLADSLSTTTTSETETDDATSRASLSGPELATRMKVGTRVIRGKDWSWDDQDGGAGNKGTVTRGVVHGWVRVRWDSGDENSYRMGNEDRYDLDLADSLSTIATSETETDDATSRASFSGPELAARMTVGTPVVRGKDWSWDDQDGGPGNKGTVIRGVVDGWVRVRWDSGDENSYRMGDEDRYDLDLAESLSTTTTSETETDDDTSRASLSGPELATRMTVGTRVIRGKDWSWDDQDGGLGNKGTITRAVVSGWVEVEWDSGETNMYRMGEDEKYDLDLADSPSTTTATNTTETNDAASRASFSGPELAARMAVGTRVVRGKDWSWDDQDGGAGNKGTIIREVVNGWLQVEWDSGETNSYRMGDEDKYDLVLADTSSFISASTTEESTTVATSSAPLFGPELAALMAVGTRVVRGRDWDWGDQDGGPGGEGTVTGPMYTGWVGVDWDNGLSYNYRMGDDEKYDLSLARAPWLSATSTTEESTTLGISSAPLSGPELAALMTVGTRVVRGRDWNWGDQDGGPGGEGTVTGPMYTGWVSVDWDNGHSYNYRMGDDEKYDLSLARAPWLSAAASTTEESTTVATSSAPLFGPELAALMTVGTRVVRGRDWDWGDQDGGPGGEGAVTGPIYTGWVSVDWDNGHSYNYRMGDDEKYDLSLARAPWLSAAEDVTTAVSEDAWTTTTTEESTSTSASTTDNVQESNRLFGQLVEQEISHVPKKNRIQTMQDILEVFKKYSRWH